MILAMLRANWKMASIALGLTAVSVYIWTLRLELDSLRKDLSLCQSQKEVLRISNEAFEKAFQEQNEKISRLNDDYARIKSETSQARERFDRSTEEGEKTIEQKVAKTEGLDKCEASRVLLTR